MKIINYVVALLVGLSFAGFGLYNLARYDLVPMGWKPTNATVTFVSRGGCGYHCEVTCVSLSYATADQQQETTSTCHWLIFVVPEYGHLPILYNPLAPKEVEANGGDQGLVDNLVGLFFAITGGGIALISARRLAKAYKDDEVGTPPADPPTTPSP